MSQSTPAHILPVEKTHGLIYAKWALLVVYMVFFASIFFSWRAITSICLPALIVASFIYNRLDTGSWWNKKLFSPFMAGALLFFGVQVAGLLYTNNMDESLQGLLQKTGILAIPLGICSSNYLGNRNFQQLMFVYIHLLCLAMIYCLAYSSIQFFVNNAGTDVFLYHELVKPAGYHAIYFSVMTFAGLTYLLDGLAREHYIYNRKAHLGILLFVFIFLILLASKLIITLSLIYTLVLTRLLGNRFYGKNKRNFYWISGCMIGIATLVMLTDNPVHRRFRDITNGKATWVFEQEKFSPANYLNGVQFRLLEWRLTGEILNEQQAWLLGVSLGDAQPLLDKKYKEVQLYTGDGTPGKHGFLGYNTHNQFLESILQSGIPGLLAFGLICFSFVQMAWRRKNHLVSGIVILVLLYAFNEAYLEAQYGIIVSLFLPLFFYYGTEEQQE
ncbi:MAG: hypothetical protein P0Y53_08700 [Candidatus Pseudobacter hemicellulosilyticus]|uniref:O-antigen ligase family protein n=1 Tax=Candidatus Pseudobacter hemicellulosilyticus TaxID=3121375 RepID=A0AAJ6BHB9_9BACT|nr:MAG: hypothetical protein P0Y53_08700 [Pseudobacter sp.]